MKDDILAELDNPRELEKLYRSNKGAFKRAFLTLYPELKGHAFADCWNERLSYESDEINWGTRTELLFVIIASLIAGVIAKLPAILHIDEEFFYSRNAGFIIFPILSAYFSWKNALSIGRFLFIAGATLGGLIFINLLPGDANKSNTLLLSCIHLPVLLWALTGYAFVGEQSNKAEPRLGYLRFNGDLVVMTALILIAGAILSGVTVGLFSLIGFNIKPLYFDYVVLVGLPAAPILGTYLTQANPQLVGKVSPVIAKIFSPLVLVMLVAYLVAIIYSGKDPYNDREFLLMFNGLLIGVMAIVFFSVAESSRKEINGTETWVLLLLSVVTIVVNGIALSAILFRISTWGITPNRVAVLGSNVLILIDLLLVTVQLYKVLTRKADVTAVGNVIARFLPVYCLWAAIVTFLFPFLFGFK
jgi:hypothetical protein